MIPVYWLAPGDQWDQTMLRDLLDGALWRPAGYPEFDHRTIERVEDIPEMVGGVLVIPGRYYASEARVQRLQAALRAWDWALVFVTSDEERLFPVEALEGDNRIVWVQTPGDGDGRIERVFGHGYTPGTRDVEWPGSKILPWFFAGQITHPRRQEMATALAAVQEAGGYKLLTETTAFADEVNGLVHAKYLATMALARVIPCPSGPATPDSFRFWEALELGCIPLADALTSSGAGDEYWRDTLDITAEYMPIPIIVDWAEVGPFIDAVLTDRDEGLDLEIGAWYLGYKRALAEQIHEDLRQVAGIAPHNVHVGDAITVLVPTSPSQIHPSTEHLEATIASIRYWLPTSPIIVSCDGVAPELEHRAENYQEYLRRVLWLCHHEWVNVQPVVHDFHMHQAGMARYALEHHVRTPQILYVEHDTPIVTDEPIDWWLLSHAIADGRLNLIRFHHEAFIPREHRHLMLDNPDLLGVNYRNVPVVRTMQWSQRPHLANARWYKILMDRYFGDEASTMIEDVMHGVADYALRERGVLAWESWKMGIYAPGGPNWKRSLHLDGRGDDPKPSMNFAYDGETPEGAPAPTKGRVD